jgi:rhodanese-related sulfurtransferase
MSTSASTLLKDCLVIVVLGCVVGLIANAVSPRGLKLTRDYFPAGAPTASRLEGDASSAPKIRDDAMALVESTPPGVASAIPVQTHTKHGLALASHDQVAALFRDPRYAEGLVVFLDARDESHYAAGHIPGAHLFDHYHMDQYTGDVLAVAPLAERIVVYCNGGDCEDSELAALDLISLGVPADKISIYGGGITEWQQRHLPTEKGLRPGQP